MADRHADGVTVRAVICLDSTAEPAHAAVQALERQTRRPDEVVCASPQQLRTARVSAAEWHWLLDASVLAEPDALERMLEAGTCNASDVPALLASKVITPDGLLDPLSLPVPETRDADAALAAAERRLVALRVARRGSLLIRGRVLEEGGPVPGRGDYSEWTARLLRRWSGQLVPSSVAVRVSAGERGDPWRRRAALLSGFRLVAGDALEAEEKPWFAFRVLEQAIGALARRPSSADRRGARARSQRR